MDKKDHPIILFDGICNYCNGMVNFLIKQDTNKTFRFVTLQSKRGQELLQQYQLPTDKLESFFYIENGKIYDRSSAGLRLYNRLPWYWKWSQLFWVFPKFIRDGVYDFIARNRYKWFGKRDKCMIPTPEVRERFLS